MSLYTFIDTFLSGILFMHTDNDYDEWTLPHFVILEAKQVKNQV